MTKKLFLAVVLATLFSSVVAAQEGEVAKETPASEGSQAISAAPEASEATKAPEASESVMIADFEGWPNNLGGEMGVYGSLEPDWDNVAAVPYSWAYETITPGYDTKNVHDGKQSFRLVNALGLKPNETWGSFAMDLGPTTNLTVVPKRVESFNASKYKYLTFWMRGEKGGEKIEFLVRDSHALNYMPQVKHKLPDAKTEWKKVVMPLAQFKGRVDLTALDNIGLAFGPDVGNLRGEIIYIDTFMFTNSAE